MDYTLESLAQHQRELELVTFDYDVAWRFHRSSLAMRLEAENAKHDFNARDLLPVASFAASGGGVPLISRNGTLIGTAAVSGLPDIEDHELVVGVLKQYLGR